MNVITNDAECVRIMGEAGVLEEFNNPPVLPGCPPLTSISIVFQHAGRWCVGVHHFGHEDSRENGYIVIPLETATKDEAEDLRLFLDFASRDRTKPPVCILQSVTPRKAA